MKHKTSIILSAAFAVLPVYADEHTIQKHGPFDALVSAIYNSYLFQRYISTWGAPLNNASFIAALLVIIFVLIIWSGIELFLNWKKSRKIMKDNSEKIEKRKQQDAEDALLREYIRFKTLAEANNVNDASEISFGQWLSARVDVGQVDEASLTPKQQEAIAEAKETVADVKESVAEKVSSVMPQKKELTEDEQMDMAIREREKEDEAVRKAKEFETKQAEKLAEMRAKEEARKPLQETPAVKKEEPKPAPKPAPKSEPAKQADWLSNAEAIKKKYSTEPKATELVDLPDMDEKAVPLSQAAIVKPVAKEIAKPVQKEEKKAIDVNKLIEEKAAEVKDDMGNLVSKDEQTAFDQIIAALNQQKAAENRAKAITAEAEKAREANIEILQGNLEQSLEAEVSAPVITERKVSREDKALEEAKKRALKEAQKEAAKGRRR